MASKPETLVYIQLSIQWHLNTNGSMVNLHEDDFKILMKALLVKYGKGHHA